MSIQVQLYVEEMKKAYLAIMKKCVDYGELSDTDIIFLDLYKRTLEGRV